MAAPCALRATTLLPHARAACALARRASACGVTRRPSPSRACVAAAASSTDAAAPAPRERFGFAVMRKGAPLEKWSFKEESPLGDTEVDIRVTHNGLCHTDMHMRDDDWHVSGFPFIPGHEVVGIVAAAGKDVPQCARVGARVGVGWIKDSCRCCRSCLRGDENVCDKGYTGLIVGAHAKGGFANYLRVKADFTYPIPDALSSADAAPLLCAGVTVYAPLARWLRPGGRVAILGVGGLGHLALQFATALGGVVTAIDIDASKAAEARGFGASEFVHAPSMLGCEAAQDAARFDLIMNTASAAVSTAALLRSLAPNGTLVQVGLPGGDAELRMSLTNLVFGQKRVVGSIVGGRADMHDMLALAAAKGIKPRVELAPLSDVNEQMARVVAGKARYRVVLLSEDEWAAEQAKM